MKFVESTKLCCGEDAQLSRSKPTVVLERQFRSREGCKTCRIRRVKCDEVRPRCGSCTRLQRKCDWVRSWRFSDCTRKIHERCNHTGLTSPDALEISSQKWQTMIASRPQSGSSNDSFGPFKPLLDESNPEQRAFTGVPGTLNVILTPKTFARSLEYRGSSRESSESSSSPPTRKARQWPVFEQRPDTTMSFNYGGWSSGSSSPSSTNLDEGEESQPWLSSPYAAHTYMEYGTRVHDDMKHIDLYEKLISMRIMPFAVKFQLNIGNDGRDIIAMAAKEFPPLRHAVCAITLLSSALHGRPNLLAGAFRHYDRAIASCRDHMNIYSSHFFYLHYLLLLHDICCLSQGWPHDAGTASRHLQHLFEIARKQPLETWSPLQAKMSWKLLFADAQSCCAGTKGAGSYVSAFKANGNALPQTHYDASAIYENTLFFGIRQLSLRMLRLTADFSQVAVAMQKASSEGQVQLDEFEDRVEELTRELQSAWATTCPQELQDGDIPMSLMSAMERSCFESAQLQYAAIAIYLHTSMYRRQRLHSSRYRDQDAHHCSFILSRTLAAVESYEVEKYNLPALFLAGFASKLEHERALAIELYQAMDDSPVSCNARRGLTTLKLVQKEQLRRCMAGGSFEEVEWSDFANPQATTMFSIFSI